MPNLVCFDHEPPRDGTEHERLFGTQLQFRSGRTVMHVRGAVLDKPNQNTDAALLRLLDSHATRSWSVSRNWGQRAGRQVHAWLIESQGAERPRVEGVARALHMSERTVRRRGDGAPRVATASSLPTASGRIVVGLGTDQGRRLGRNVPRNPRGGRADR